MNIIINSAEDSSDAFFKTKHVHRKKEEFNKKKLEVVYKLINGLEDIKAACKNEEWVNDKEKLFLKLFSKLYVAKRFRIRDHTHRFFKDHGYYLFDIIEREQKICFYSIDNEIFWLDWSTIWRDIIFHFNHMKYEEVKQFIKDMLIKYFKMDDVETATLHQ